MKGLDRIDGLRDAIRAGEFCPGQMVGTEYAFARDWDLSRHTVRRCIDALICEGLLERRPGKGIFVRPTHTTTRKIQVVGFDLECPRQLQIVQGIQVAARPFAVEVLLSAAQSRFPNAVMAIRKLASDCFDGAIVFVAPGDLQLCNSLLELKSQSFPLVIIKQQSHGESPSETPTIEIDSYNAAYSVGQKLVSLGHRRAVLFSLAKHSLVEDRVSGFRDAITDAGMLFCRSSVVYSDCSGSSSDRAAMAENALTSIFSRRNRPSAIFDATGDAVPYIYRAAQRLGMRIPSDLSVVAFDSTACSHPFQSSVTRLAQPLSTAGRVAAELLLQQMGRIKSRNADPRRVLRPEWKAGASLAPPVRSRRTDVLPPMREPMPAFESTVGMCVPLGEVVS